MLLGAGHPVWMSFPHSSSKSSIFPVNDPWMACFIFERLRKHVRFLSDRISFFPTSEETHNFIYLERNVSNPIFTCFLCWTKITFWPLLTLFWSNSKVTYVQAGVSFDQWNGAFCFHLGQSELRVLCHVFHLMLTTWSSSTACNFEKLL